ncbi:helix-turn-helix transcriptional regulator [Halorussus marinus]|uniref:helix-turn-helix transcriptional regulator n=1 Tax=Halorussus marinus TaxID=2505976 RepID=UPI00106E41F3|nr:helix-turn-helix transcriptional regulator [Halorussus marinus]
MSAEIAFTDLHAFRRDLLYAVRTLERDEPPKGLAVKQHLEADYGETINHSRLYQNLDELVERGLLAKGKKDDRTNEYQTTETARALLEAATKRRANALGLAVEGGAER